MRAVIPFKKVNPKSRLSEALTSSQRQEFAQAMLHDVVSALKRSGKFSSIDILSASLSGALNTDYPAGVNVLVSEKSLNDALNEYLASSVKHRKDEILIIMADMPLITHKHITAITDIGSEVVIAPGSRGGTNALFIRSPEKFHVDYYGTSFLDHLRIAKDAGLTIEVYDSFLVSTDMDEPGDLVELLIHGRGRSVDYLRSIGISLDTETGTLIKN